MRCKFNETLRVWIKTLSLIFLSINLEVNATTTTDEIILCPGGQHTLVCSTNHIFLVWSVRTTSQLSLHEMRTIPSSDQDPVITPIRVNSASITFSRDSPNMALPLISTMTIDNVNSNLEGALITCTGQNSSSVSSVVMMTTVHVNNDIPNPPMIAIKSNRTLFENGKFTVTLEWSQFSGETYTVTTVPDPVHKNYTLGSTNIQLVMHYNTPYNVTVTATLCGHRNATNFTAIYHSKCDLPILREVIISVDTEGPLIGGSTISYSCSTGQTINGPNTSTCMDNGNWEPDPMDIMCIAICGPPSTPRTRNSYIYPFPNISSRVIIICTGSDRIYTSNCHPNGIWQPNPDNVCELSQAICVPPSSPHNGYIYPYPNINSRVIVVCHGSDMEGLHISNCHPNGTWQPNPGNVCDTAEIIHDTKPTLSVSTTAIISSLSSSFVFFIIGLLCGQITRLFPKRNKQPHPSETLQLHYEVVPYSISNCQEEHKAVNLQPNEAYGQLRGARNT